MAAYSRKTWFFVGFVIIAMLGLIGDIEVQLPEGSLSTTLMLGVTALGYGAIFAWLYFHRAQPAPPKPARRLRLSWPVDQRFIQDAPTFEESLTVPKVTPKDVKGLYN